MNWHERCPKIMGVHEMVVVVDVVEGVHGLGGSIELPRQVHMHWRKTFAHWQSLIGIDFTSLAGLEFVNLSHSDSLPIFQAYMQMATAYMETNKVHELPQQASAYQLVLAKLAESEYGSGTRSRNPPTRHA